MKKTAVQRAKTGVLGLTITFLLIGCASTPQGPSVQVMPAPNKPFDVFQADQATCKQYAEQEVSGQAQSANNQALGTAVIGTILGAGLGAAVGGGHGAAIGAASGAVAGTAIGANGSQYAQGGIQQQYDNAYLQCMYAKGNQVPGYSSGPSAPPPPPPGSGPYAPPPLQPGSGSYPPPSGG